MSRVGLMVLLHEVLSNLNPFQLTPHILGQGSFLHDPKMQLEIQPSYPHFRQQDGGRGMEEKGAKSTCWFSLN